MTKTKTIAIAEASPAELTAYATLTLGLEVKPNTPLPALRAMIARTMPGTDIIVIPAAEDDADATAAPLLDAGRGAAPLAIAGAASRLELIQQKAGTVSASGRYDPLVTVLVYEGQEDGGKRPVPVGVNGTIILVPRGKPVQLPYRYYEALKNAERVTYSEGADGELLEHKMAAYPFQTIQPADPAELAAWLDATADKFAA